MTAPQITAVDGDRGIFRVGRGPQLWNWVDWQWAKDRRFTGRWDDPDGAYRVLYTGSALYVCLLESLADLRPAPDVAAALDEIEDADDDGGLHATQASGTLSYSWLENRMVGTAHQRGAYLPVTDSAVLGIISRAFNPLDYDIQTREPIDASTLKRGDAKPLTRAVSRWSYTLTNEDGGALDGIQYRSRFGDEFELWAIFERDPGHGDRSELITDWTQRQLHAEDPDLVKAMQTHGLTWPE